MCGPQLSGEMAFALYAEGRACPAPTWRQECGVIAAAKWHGRHICVPCSVAAAVRFCGGVKTPPYRAGGKRG